MKRRYFVLALIAAALLVFCACAQSSDFLASPDGAAVEYTVSENVAAPVYSHETGRYSDSFTLTVTAPKGTVVRYTLDGSQPTAQSDIFPAEGLLIEDRSKEKNVLSAIPASEFTAESDHTPEKVNKGTVIRSAAFDNKGRCSRTATATYLVGLYYKDIKIVSLVMDSDDLFDYYRGIYVFGKSYDEWMKNDPEAKNAETWELEGNFSQKGRAWERPVTVQVIEKDGSFGIEQDMGIRVMGAATRRYYQKSFRLTAREEYGAKHFEYELIDGLVTDGSGEPLDKYKSFVLRNGGNDYGYALMRDAFIQSRVADRDFTTQQTEPAIVFINGEYWGLYTITEDYSDNYIQYNLGVDNENVIMVKNYELEEGTEEDMSLFWELDGAIYSRDFTDSTDYEWLCSAVDMDNLIDYFAVNLYINNEDGIFNYNNWRLWRARETDFSNEYADGRWRFMLYDTEFSLGLYNDGKNYNDNTLAEAMANDVGWGLLLSKLMQNDEFRTRMINTIMDLRNTAFYPEDAAEALTLLKLRYEPYSAEQYLRNGPSWVIEWTDVNTRMTTEVNCIRRFINGRYKYVKEMLGETLGLGECCTVTIGTSDVSGGTVTINTITPQFEDGLWEGEYFRGVELTLTAQPAPGYTFVKWTGDIRSQSDTVVYTPYGDIEVTAVFEKADM